LEVSNGDRGKIEGFLVSLLGRSPDASALLQEMSAERNNRITRTQTRDHGAFAAQPNKFDGPKAYG
jgi:hypothetical protein